MPQSFSLPNRGNGVPRCIGAVCGVFNVFNRCLDKLLLNTKERYIFAAVFIFTFMLTFAFISVFVPMYYNSEEGAWMHPKGTPRRVPGSGHVVHPSSIMWERNTLGLDYSKPATVAAEHPLACSAYTPAPARGERESDRERDPTTEAEAAAAVAQQFALEARQLADETTARAAKASREAVTPDALDDVAVLSQEARAMEETALAAERVADVERAEVEAIREQHHHHHHHHQHHHIPRHLYPKGDGVRLEAFVNDLPNKYIRLFGHHRLTTTAPHAKYISYDGELGYDLIGVIPYAYALALRGELAGTASPRGSDAQLYFWSPHHATMQGRVRKARMWPDVVTHAGNFGYEPHPHVTNHKDFPVSGDPNWVVPPYRDWFGNSIFTWSKPIAYISNKYSDEWASMNHPNSLPLEALREIISILKQKYQVVYMRPSKGDFTSDSAVIVEDYGDHEMIRNEFSDEVVIVQDLRKAMCFDLDLNTFQMMIMANSRRFVSVQGGNAVLTSLWGGENIVFVQKGQEMKNDEFEYLYPQLSGALVRKAMSNETLIEMVREYV
eukprot:TRINITY_DN4298_c0_g1_i1.p1 TRINITY_DN4298_c0_g1~~TRINITY_DN4298_c0_g1_i1.p1  ORF type:complete len:554 (+),score=98.84 TRINITY_DN4298_c0_g1_i1:156-1817(+)